MTIFVIAVNTSADNNVFQADCFRFSGFEKPLGNHWQLPQAFWSSSVVSWQCTF